MRRPAAALVYMPREIGLKDFILVEEDVLVQEEQRNSSAAISKTLACILLQETWRGGAWGKKKNPFDFSANLDHFLRKWNRGYWP